MSHDGVYEDIQDIDKLKKHMKDTLDEYNSTPGVINMNLVLFKDAIDHGKPYFIFSAVFRNNGSIW